MPVSYNDHRLSDCTLHMCMSSCGSVPWILNTYYIFNQIQQRWSWFHLPSTLVETLAHSSVGKKTNLWFELYTCFQTSFQHFIPHQHLWKPPKPIHSSMASSKKCFPPIRAVSVRGLVQRSCLWLFPVVLILQQALHWSFLISSDFVLIQAPR